MMGEALRIVRNDFVGAESIHREVLAKRRALLGNDHLLVTTSLNNLATVLQSDGRFGEAEAFHREALAPAQIGSVESE